MDKEDLLLSSYHYLLPESLIAQEPSMPAHQAKMMVCSLEKDGDIKTKDQLFLDLEKTLDAHYVLFLNRTKVFKARIPLNNTKIMRKSGKEVLLETGEIFVYTIMNSQECECLVSDSKNFRPGAKIFFEDGVIWESVCFTEQGILFCIQGDEIFDFLEKRGHLPLPPYISYEKEKEQRYQTFFAEEFGSCAAPTASLHFSPELVRKLVEKKVGFQYLCLHVGLGTFKPIYEEHIEAQQLHCEPMVIETSFWEEVMKLKQAKKIFLPVGTTMIRYLESLPYIWRFLKKKNLVSSFDIKTQERRNSLTEELDEQLVDEFIPEQEIKNGWYEDGILILQTRLFLRPGIPFLLTDELITNFHLPKSSLMMLISAFMGRKNLLNCYQEAIEKKYRFYSFGDGMRIKKALN